MQKTIAPFAANLLRKDMGEGPFSAWMQKNGIIPGEAQQQPAPPQTGLASLLTPQQQAMGAQPLQAVPGGPSAEGLAALLPQFADRKIGTFDKGGKGWKILGIIGDALQTAGGGQATYAPMILQQQELETQGRQKLAELMAQQQQKQQERAAEREDWQYKEGAKISAAARMAREAGLQPGTSAYQQFITTVAQRPIMIGGEAYAPTQGGGLPSGYNPNEWEVVE